MKLAWIYNVAAAFFLFSIAALFIRFLAYHEVRTDELGVRLNDPVMYVLPRFDMSVSIFTLTYGSLILYVYYSWSKPFQIGHLMIAYGIMLILRALTLTIVPLQAPYDLVHLQDPFLDNLIYPRDIKNDLFFSGHTALLFLIYFLIQKKVFLYAGLMLGIMLMMQRVHYSIDIIGAIPITYMIVRLVRVLSSKFGFED